MTAMTRHTPHRPAALVATLATLSLILGGCTTAHKEQPIKTTEKQALAECARITTELKAFPGVTDATCDVGGYDSNVVVSPVISVNATIDANSRVGPVADKATELAWLSALQPLETLAVTLTTPDAKRHEYTYLLSDGEQGADVQELTKQFGPRPSPSIAP